MNGDEIAPPHTAGDTSGGTLNRRTLWRALLPVLVSGGLVTLVLRRISPEELTAAAARLDWPALLVLTVAFVLALYFYDAVCLRWLFSQPDLSMSYRTALHARGSAYLFSALNYGLGQGMLSWYMSRAQKLPLLGSLSRLALLLMHDMVVLLTMGLAASLFSELPEVVAVRVSCAVMLGTLAVLLGAAAFLPERARERFRATKWGNWLSWWSVGRSVRLCGLRAVYFSIVISYVACGLAICRVEVDPHVLYSAVPMVVLIEGLPISVSGLGTRETTMPLLLNLDEHQRVIVVAFSFLWSFGLMSGRLLLGLGHWWLPRLLR